MNTELSLRGYRRLTADGWSFTAIETTAGRVSIYVARTEAEQALIEAQNLFDSIEDAQAWFETYLECPEMARLRLSLMECERVLWPDGVELAAEVGGEVA